MALRRLPSVLAGSDRHRGDAGSDYGGFYCFPPQQKSRQQQKKKSEKERGRHRVG